MGSSRDPDCNARRPGAPDGYDGPGQEARDRRIMFSSWPGLTRPSRSGRHALGAGPPGFAALPGDGADVTQLLQLDLGADLLEGGLDLLGGRSGGAGSRAGRNRDGGGGGDAPLLLEELRELGGLENGQRRQVVDDLGQISHG